MPRDNRCLIVKTTTTTTAICAKLPSLVFLPRKENYQFWNEALKWRKQFTCFCFCFVLRKIFIVFPKKCIFPTISTTTITKLQWRWEKTQICHFCQFFILLLDYYYVYEIYLEERTSLQSYMSFCNLAWIFVKFKFTSK